MKRHLAYFCSLSGCCWQKSYPNNLIFEHSVQDLVTMLKVMVKIIIKLYITMFFSLLSISWHNVQADTCFASSESMEIHVFVFHVLDGLDSFSRTADLNLRDSMYLFP